MSDIGSGTVDAPINDGNVAVKETSESPQDTGNATPDTGTGQAGGSQETAESGSVNANDVRQRGPSKLDTIRELRAKLREQRSYWESEMGQLKTQMEELKNGFASGQRGAKPSKTFWEDPEGILEEKIGSHLSEMEKRMLTQIDKRQSMDQESSDWRQETSEAAKFIQAQKGITAEDEEDIAEIVRTTPAMAQMRPMDRAKYAWFLWKEERGITDKSAAKQRASTVVGTPPGAGGARNWTETEIDAEIKKFPPNPKDWSAEQTAKFQELDSELKRAYRENRVKK